MYQIAIPKPFPAISLPEGFRLTSLAEECDWAKVHKVLWCGFDHGDEVAMGEEEFERRLGLGKAAVLEGIRRCGALGATVVYVGSNQPFYQAIGFKKVYNSECWVKYFG